jgi:hypothetical protein
VEAGHVSECRGYRKTMPHAAEYVAAAGGVR